MSRWSNLTIDKNEMKYEIKMKYEISTNNLLFGRAIWDRLSNVFLEILKFHKGNFEIFKNYEGDLS